MSEVVQLSGLIKIGELEHIQKLQSKGLLYLNNLKYYREMESKEKHLRRDVLEGSSSHINLTTLQLFDGTKELPLKFKSGHLNEYIPENLKHHIFCIYGIKSEIINSGPFISADLIQFGDSALIITDIDEFIKRINNKLKLLKFNCKMGFVKYYDPTKNHMNLTAFDKPDYYEYQNEIRLLVMGHPEPTLEIEIGSISDISVIVDSNDLLKLTIETEELENK